MKKILIAIISILMLCSCSTNNNGTNDENINKMIYEPDARPSLLNGVDVTYDEEIIPQVETYTLNEDFSNVLNPWDITGLDDEAKAKLLQNYFVACESDSEKEFFNVYYFNWYDMIPSFITTDSAFHMFHLFYEYLQRITEKNYLLNRIEKMSIELLHNSQEQLEQLKGTPWENAAQRNVDYFSVAVALCGGIDYVENENIRQELNNIENAGGIDVSPIFSTTDNGYKQDYSQFIVRGYYADSEELQKYFKVMMWYGQMTFLQKSDDLSRSALLINLALKDEALEDFECVYEITSFFAGEPDDNTYYEYFPIIEFYFGDDPDLSSVVDKTEEFDEYLKYIADLPAPQINSMIVSGYSDVEKETAGFRLLGQRYSLDSWIIENITFNKVKELDTGNARVLPKVLDVAAALGSDTALNIVNETDGESIWPTYAEQMNYIRSEVNKKGNALFSNSVSSGWLGALSKSLEEKGENWPTFMQSKAWTKKNLMTFLGGYTELKHDLILYAKQHNGGKGGDGPIPKDDRGYVEPEPIIYHRLASIVEATASGLNSYQLISENDLSELQALIDTYNTLERISRKELNSELPTDDEFDFIRHYDAKLKHIWGINASEKAGYNIEGYDGAEKEYPSMLVTDISTDFDKGMALEIGNERPMVIYVAVYFDGHVRITRGVTFSSVEFTVPIEKRTTDLKWKEIIYSNNREIIPPLPSWYEEIYVKNGNYSGTEFMGAEGMAQIAEPNMLEIKTGAINVRNLPSKTANTWKKVTKGQKMQFYFSIKNEGYTWYYLGYDGNDQCWIADDGTWVDILSYNGDQSDGEYLKKDDIRRIQILNPNTKIYSSPSLWRETDEYANEGDTFLTLLVEDKINNIYEWDDEFSVGYVWYQIGNGKWVKDRDGSQVAVIEGPPVDYSNSNLIFSDTSFHDLLSKKTIEIMDIPLRFRNGKGELITFNGKEYASPGEIYDVIYFTGDPLLWAKLDEDVYVFLGEIGNPLVR